MHTEFKPWLADRTSCYQHIQEFIKYSNAGKMFKGILEEEVDDLATDCWIWIWEGSCTARTAVKEAYGDNLVLGWDGDKMARMTVKVAATYYLRQRGTKNKRTKKFRREVYQEMLMDADIKTTGERVELDLAKEEKVLMLWNAGELSTDDAMGRLQLSSRQSLYTRFEHLVQRLKKELLPHNTAE